MGTFFNSFRKGPAVCRGLDIDLSRKEAKNDSIVALYSLYTKVLANSTGMHTRTVIFTHSDCETHGAKLIIPRIPYLLLRCVARWRRRHSRQHKMQTTSDWL